MRRDEGRGNGEGTERALAIADVLAEMSVAATTGAITGGPLAAVLAAASPVAVRGLQILARRVAEVEQEALRSSGLTAEELAARLLDDEVRFSVAQRVFTGAQSAATAEKRLLLGRMLANAALEDAVDVDEMLIHAQILVELEGPHILVLRLLEGAEQGEVPKDPGTGGVSVAMIAERLPGLSLYLQVIFTRLQGQALIEDAAAGTWDGFDTPLQLLKLSEFGKDFLRMLRDPLGEVEETEE